MNITAANADAVLGEWAHRGRCLSCGWVGEWVPLDEARAVTHAHVCDPAAEKRAEIPGQLGLL